MSVPETVGKSQTPLVESVLQELVKAHTDAQHRPRNTGTCHLHRWDIREQSLLLSADYLSSPLRVPAGGRREVHRRKVNEPEIHRYGCASSLWKPLHGKVTAALCLPAPLVCVRRRLIPHAVHVPDDQRARQASPPQEESQHPQSLRTPWIYWFDVTSLTVQVTFLHMVTLLLLDRVKGSEGAAPSVAPWELLLLRAGWSGQGMTNTTFRSLTMLFHKARAAWEWPFWLKWKQSGAK